jgi:Skp family chaperone for outer membrane proteins
VKSKTVLIAAVAAVLTLTVGASQARAQYSKIGFVNIEAVLQKYQKAKAFKDEMEELKKPYKAQLDKLQTEIVAWSKDLAKLTDPKEKERYEAGIVHHRRKIEDLKKEVERNIGKRWEDQMIQLYKEVHENVKTYAAANGFHAVLAYADPTELDPFSFPMIQRKVQGMSSAAALTAFYVDPNLEVSAGVANQLNQRYGGATVPGTPVSRPGGN